METHTINVHMARNSVRYAEMLHVTKVVNPGIKEYLYIIIIKSINQSNSFNASAKYLGPPGNTLYLYSIKMSDKQKNNLKSWFETPRKNQVSLHHQINNI